MLAVDKSRELQPKARPRGRSEPSAEPPPRPARRQRSNGYAPVVMRSHRPLIVGRAYEYGGALDRLLYEYGKDIVTYAIVSASTIAFAQ